jgi:hypothetical protein
MKQENRQEPVHGTLHTNFGEYDMLTPKPNKYDVPMHLREAGAVSFYVRDGYGLAKTIFVKGEFLIDLFPVPEMRPTTFIIEEVADEVGV